MRRASWTWWWSLVLLIATTSCSTVSENERVDLVVSAASSLTDAFNAIKTGFEAAHPDIRVRLNLGGSSTLREQILAGAPADVFASANLGNMEELAEAGRIDKGFDIFAKNSMEIAVPANNPGSVTGLDDFANPDLAIGLCAESVPCGSFARVVLAKNGTTPSVDTNEGDVRALLSKIELGELDAAIVYVTDVASAGPAVMGITIPAELNVVAEYPVAVVTSSSHLEEAQEFVEFLMSPMGQSILSGLGFGPP